MPEATEERLKRLRQKWCQCSQGDFQNMEISLLASLTLNLQTEYSGAAIVSLNPTCGRA